MKTCTKCLEGKDKSEFFKRKMSKDGLQPTCKICDTKSRKERKKLNPEHEINYQKEYREKNLEKKKASDKRWYCENKDKCKIVRTEYYQKNKETINRKNNEYFKKNQERLKQKSREYRNRNIEEAREKRRQHYKDNKYMYIANAAQRRAIELQATPSWADLEAIKQIYKECEEITQRTNHEHHVDHIIPLRHKNVSGLHVPWNLQILTWEENCKKGNSFQS